MLMGSTALTVDTKSPKVERNDESSSIFDQILQPRHEMECDLKVRELPLRQNVFDILILAGTDL
jgi:hypothetical protein